MTHIRTVNIFPLFRLDRREIHVIWPFFIYLYAFVLYDFESALLTLYRNLVLCTEIVLVNAAFFVIKYTDGAVRHKVLTKLGETSRNALFCGCSVEHCHYKISRITKPLFCSFALLGLMNLKTTLNSQQSA